MLCLCEFTIIVSGQCIGGNAMKFELLADSIKQINDKASSAAKSAVNQLMTLRNWAIGYYIVEYEQDGSDRAEYGSHLLKNLEKVRQCRTNLSQIQMFWLITCLFPIFGKLWY